MRPKVLVTHWIQPEIAAAMGDFAEVDAPRERIVYPPEELRGRGHDARAMMVCMADMVDRGLLDACPNLRIVAAAVNGVSNIDVGECTRRGVWVTNCPDLLTAPTAELIIGMMITLGRRLYEAQAKLAQGFSGWRPILFGKGMAQQTVGLVGMGRLGRAVAARLNGFEMSILYHDRQPLTPAGERALGVRYCDFDGLLARSDYVVLLLPLTDKTRCMLGYEKLSLMRRDAILVNCARGSIVDEEAVANALELGLLGGYAADVYGMEDFLLPDRPPGISRSLLRQRERVLLTPHIGSAVEDIRKRINLTTMEQIRAVLNGNRPELAINDIGTRSECELRSLGNVS